RGEIFTVHAQASPFGVACSYARETKAKIRKRSIQGRLWTTSTLSESLIFVMTLMTQILRLSENQLGVVYSCV
ncbi:MAG TPA: hypothetical protein VJ917_06125, partial [Saprospiraceae bacterium]|nr:hypothetical protein [Saprospiraceae bacterium]